MNFKTIQDLDVKDKTVLVRVDYNVPIEDGMVDDTLRIVASFETIKYLLERNCRIILISHLGEPKGGFEAKFSLELVAKKASELLGQPIKFVADCIGLVAQVAVDALQPKDIILLENLRFHPEETANDENFAKILASYADAYVDDAFAVLHRAHASVVGIPKWLPSGAGFLVEREVKTIHDAMHNPKRPFLAVIGGSKISSKIRVIDHLLPKVDFLLIGGAMADTFLAAIGTPIGKSLSEPDQKQVAEKVLDDAETHGIEVILPVDVVVAQSVEDDAPARTISAAQVQPTDIIVDLGPETVDTALERIRDGGTVIWNGPLGITEIDQFCAGSLRLAQGIIASGAHSLIGGGDTADFVDQAGLHDKFSFVSTGGGASLELMSGNQLPGLTALQE